MYRPYDKAARGQAPYVRTAQKKFFLLIFLSDK